MADPDPATAAAAAVQAVSLKLPTFLASRPDVWFQQTEAQFALRNITDSTTQYYYLSSLPWTLWLLNGWLVMWL